MKAPPHFSRRRGCEIPFWNCRPRIPGYALTVLFLALDDRSLHRTNHLVMNNTL
ncbi:hypothetical protein SAMN05421823_104272 [Catalinimonas alkaloidigena]|uniref:Uncharacterized protein n=1 Tax=Catalinimonas alkaloidigena TaxID=1075417 RepID=A0A1G9H003_9BACT|nr:hypothetical protein [Catalinimonas alkaloidigena]SDL06185.1 hypothetical protein SAMN05421823_104272 [Catalinimonas alkaloidigena]